MGEEGGKSAPDPYPLSSSSQEKKSEGGLPAHILTLHQEVDASAAAAFKPNLSPSTGAAGWSWSPGWLAGCESVWGRGGAPAPLPHTPHAQGSANATPAAAYDAPGLGTPARLHTSPFPAGLAAPPDPELINEFITKQAPCRQYGVPLPRFLRTLAEYYARGDLSARGVPKGGGCLSDGLSRSSRSSLPLRDALTPGPGSKAKAE
ncbi:hypothetical protein AAFF_G00107090 [Aldrovandia affinis]|uniref:Uncharacterized protein n=1 Tax=Aldrovandia affinis TaxID=143900 RepID=A0AAD7WXR9_9TELE|nr:hypothetical protein AAFF_G00107090 [Aldrovandia affinis]